MARISGVDLPREKRVEIGLTYIFGIGVKTSQEILAATGVNPDTRVKDLTEQDVNKIRESPQGSARSRPEHQAERSYPQGPEEDHRRQEEGNQIKEE